MTGGNLGEPRTRGVHSTSTARSHSPPANRAARVVHKIELRNSASTKFSTWWRDRWRPVARTKEPLEVETKPWRRFLRAVTALNPLVCCACRWGDVTLSASVVAAVTCWCRARISWGNIRRSVFWSIVPCIDHVLMMELEQGREFLRGNAGVKGIRATPVEAGSRPATLATLYAGLFVYVWYCLVVKIDFRGKITNSGSILSHVVTSGCKF